MPITLYTLRSTNESLPRMLPPLWKTKVLVMRRSLSRVVGLLALPASLLLALLLSPWSATQAAEAKPAVQPGFSEPIQVERRDNIRVVYDIKVDDWAAGIGRGLYYVRGLLEAYKSQGVDMDQLHISIVLHGKPVAWLLSEQAWQDHSGDPFANNPNEHVIEGLLEHGVSIEACNVTMKSMGIDGGDLLPAVKVVHDGYTRLIDLQQRGYAYIRF